MAPKKMNPASGAADRARNCFAVAATGSENNAPKPEIQDRRAHWLARRFRLSLAMAEAVATLHFGEVRA
jgi:hypothetical protein